MKNITVLIHDDGGQEARLQAALDLTRALDGHLTCIDVIQIPTLVGDYYSAAGEAMLLADERARESVNEQKLKARLAGEDVPWNWINVTGDMVLDVQRLTALSDLIVVNGKNDPMSTPGASAVTSSMIHRSGKPVAAIPEGYDHFDVSGPVLIAWNGSMEAASTLQASVALIGKASTVRLFQVGDPQGIASIEEAATYLSRHGIAAETKVQPGNTGRVAAAILDECRAFNASWGLLGAFGRSWLVEAVMGSTTRDLLHHSPIPLVLGR